MIQVTIETIYYTVTSTKNLPFEIWVPSWTQGSAQSTISVNGVVLTALNPSAETSLQAVEVCLW